MPFEKSYDTPKPVTSPPCIHLRSKAMYVTGDRNMDDPDEGGSQHCWCNLTQHVIGPDQADVSRVTCVPGRSCYRETY